MSTQATQENTGYVLLFFMFCCCLFFEAILEATGADQFEFRSFCLLLCLSQHHTTVSHAQARLAWGSRGSPTTNAPAHSGHLGGGCRSASTQGSMRKARSLSACWLLRVRRSGRRSSSFGKSVLSSGRRLVMRERRAFIRFSCRSSTAPTSTIPERSGDRRRRRRECG